MRTRKTGRLGRKLASWRRLAPRQRSLALDALMALVLAKVLVTAVPFRLYVPVLRQARARQVASDASIVDVKRALGRVGAALPWRTACLDRAIAAKLMLARRGIHSSLHLGLLKGDAGLQAHAWLTTGDQVVVGALGRQGMVDLVQFGAPRADG